MKNKTFVIKDNRDNKVCLQGDSVEEAIINGLRGSCRIMESVNNFVIEEEKISIFVYESCFSYSYGEMKDFNTFIKD